MELNCVNLHGAMQFHTQCVLKRIIASTDVILVLSNVRTS